MMQKEHRRQHTAVKAGNKGTADVWPVVCRTACHWTFPRQTQRTACERTAKNSSCQAAGRANSIMLCVRGTQQLTGCADQLAAILLAALAMPRLLLLATAAQLQPCYINHQ